MIVESMNWQELEKEVYSDYSNIDNCSLRLFHEYDRERRKKKINKSDEYPPGISYKDCKKEYLAGYLIETPYRK